MLLTIFVSASFLSVGLLLRTEWKGRQLTKMTCEQLMAHLRAVNLEQIALVALESPGSATQLESVEIWTIIGGVRGLLEMYSNTALLLALAEQAAAWDSRASAVAIGRMRDDLLIMRHAGLYSLCSRALARGRHFSITHVHRTANAYYGMTELLLTLYEQSPSRLYTHLNTSLGRA